MDILCKEDNFLWFPVCFPVHQIPCEKNIYLKRNNLLKEGRQNYFDQVVFPESVSNPLKLSTEIFKNGKLFIQI